MSNKTEREAYKEAVEDGVLNDPMNENEPISYGEDNPVTDEMGCYTYCARNGGEFPNELDPERTAFNIRWRYTAYQNFIEMMDADAHLWDLPITGWAESIVCKECERVASRKGIRLAVSEKRPVWNDWEEHTRIGGDFCEGLCPDCTDDPDRETLTADEIVSSPLWGHRHEGGNPDEGDLSTDWRDNDELTA